MDALDSLSSIFWDIGDAFGYLGDTAGKIPLIGGWGQMKFYQISDWMHGAAGHIKTTSSWSDLVSAALNDILPWDTIRGYILGTWTWLNTIDDKIVDRARSVWTWLDTIDDKITARARSVWTWLDTIDDKIVSRVRSTWTWLDSIDDRILARARSTWTWLDTIDDRILARARSTWTWLDSIDDRIRDVAWNHVRDQLSTWIWDFLEARALDIARVGYRVLKAIWDMEWDDDNKEVKS
jgi:hypothetical protein